MIKALWVLLAAVITAVVLLLVPVRFETTPEIPWVVSDFERGPKGVREGKISGNAEVNHITGKSMAAAKMPAPGAQTSIKVTCSRREMFNIYGMMLSRKYKCAEHGKVGEARAGPGLLL